MPVSHPQQNQCLIIRLEWLRAVAQSFGEKRLPENDILGVPARAAFRSRLKTPRLLAFSGVQKPTENVHKEEVG
jgi:hypothetical protein